LAKLRKFFDIQKLRGIAAFLICLMVVSLFPASFAEFRIIPYFFSDKTPSVVVHIGNNAVNKSQANLTVSANNKLGSIMHFYLTAKAIGKGANPVRVNCVQKYDHRIIRLGNNTKPLLRNNVNIACFAIDRESNTRIVNLVVNVRDFTAPVIQQHEAIYVRASSPPGVFLRYAVKISDPDSPYSDRCTPKSGTFIPAANISVTCSAVDPAGNRSPRNMTFPVVIHNGTNPVIPTSSSTIAAIAGRVSSSLIYALCGNQSLQSRNTSSISKSTEVNTGSYITPVGRVNICNLTALNAHLRSVDQGVSNLTKITLSGIDKRTTGIGTNITKINGTMFGVGTNLSGLATNEKSLANTVSGIERRTNGIGNNIAKINRTIDDKLGSFASDIITLNETISRFVQGTIPKSNNQTILSSSVLTLAKKIDPLSTDIKNLSASVSKPSGSTPTGILPLDVLIGLGAVIVAGAAAVIAYYANRWIQKRQERVEMSKLKMQTITEMLPLYGQLATYYLSFSSQLKMMKEKQRPPDVSVCFYAACHILLRKRKLFQKYGGFILDDLDAETIINRFNVEIDSQLRKGNVIDNYYIGTVLNLITEDMSYTALTDKFEENDQNRALRQKFGDWLLKSYLEMNQQDGILRLEEKCRWFNKLIFLEMNQIFHRWYDINPSLYNLDEDLQTYLSEGYKEDSFFKGGNENERENARKQRVYVQEFTNYYNRLQRLERERARTIERRR